jgi:NAD(P)-dependent dehydrogenase (short-subunit alcohol dehydrogenase family)
MPDWRCRRIPLAGGRTSAMSKAAFEGRTVLVTGGSRGFGLAIAEGFASAGAHVAITSRSEADLQAAAPRLLHARVDPAQDVWTFAADVTDGARMDRGIEAWVDRHGRLDVLVNNAAIQGPIGAFETLDWTEWTRALEADLIAPIRLCRAVLPHMRRTGRGKIINVSGGGATGPRPRFSAYATAKCALVRFTETLAVELAGSGIDVNAVSPGPMNTRMLEEVLAAGSEAAGAEYARAIELRETGTPPERATALVVFLASAASDGITGRLISAVWDPWEALAAHHGDLGASDVYTLRRIVPKDRGFTWGER